MKRRTVLAGLGATAAAGALGMPSILRAQAPVTLNGAVQFNDDHAFNRALLRFEELVKKYYGKPKSTSRCTETLHLVSRSSISSTCRRARRSITASSRRPMSTFAKAAPFIDAPFVFKGIEHMNKVVERTFWRRSPMGKRC